MLPLVLLLSGCLKMDTNFKISADDRVTGSMLLAIQQQYAGLIRDTCDPKTAGQGTLPEGTITPYTDGGYVGCTITFSGPTSAFNDSKDLIIRHQDGQYLFFMVNRPSDTASGMSGTPETSRLMFDSFRVSVTFPGQVTSHSGSSTVQGTTVTWTDPMDMVSGDGLKATSQEASALQAALPWAMEIGAGLLLVGLVAVVVVIGVRRRRAAAMRSATPVNFGPPLPAPFQPPFFNPADASQTPPWSGGDPGAHGHDASGPIPPETLK